MQYAEFYHSRRVCSSYLKITLLENIGSFKTEQDRGSSKQLKCIQKGYCQHI